MPVAYATIVGSIAKVLFYKLPYPMSSKFQVLIAVLSTNIFLFRFKYSIIIIIIIIIFIYLFIYQVTSFHKKKTATSSRSITKASKYAIPLKPTHKLAESKRYLVTW